MVYVDPLCANGWVLRGRNVKNCHLVADTEAELHDLAARIGMKRSWFQGGRIPHYDLTEARRAAAVLAGAKELSRREMGLWIRARKAAAAAP